MKTLFVIVSILFSQVSFAHSYFDADVYVDSVKMSEDAKSVEVSVSYAGMSTEDHRFYLMKGGCRNTRPNDCFMQIIHRAPVDADPTEEGASRVLKFNLVSAGLNSEKFQGATLRFVGTGDSEQVVVIP